MITMQRKCLMKVSWLCLLLAILWCAPAYGQDKEQDAFATVPAFLRANLAERLKLLVEYQRTQQWEKHYDLLFFTYTEGTSKEEYVNRNRRWYTEVVPDDLILDFTPKVTTMHEASAEAGWWTIEGCAKFRKKGRIVELHASVDAHREGGNWYFSSVGAITPVGGDPKPCPYSRAAARPSPGAKSCVEKSL